MLKITKELAMAFKRYYMTISGTDANGTKAFQYRTFMIASPAEDEDRAQFSQEIALFKKECGLKEVKEEGYFPLDGNPSQNIPLDIKFALDTRGVEPEILTLRVEGPFPYPSVEVQRSYANLIRIHHPRLEDGQITILDITKI